MSKRKRRKFSAEFKAEIMLSVLTGEKSQAAICREHELSAQQFSNWKRQFLGVTTRHHSKSYHHHT